MALRYAGALAGGLVVLLSAAHAPAATRLVAVVLVASDEERELAGRVEGQTSDLELSLVVEPRPLDEGGRPHFGEAAEIARRRGARVVIWFEREVTSWSVHIAEPAGDREFVRRVAARGDLASSATAEGVALVVRGALRALAAGGTIGVAEPGAPGAGESARHAFAALGWRTITSRGPLHHGVAARAGFQTGRWHAGVAAGYFPAVSFDEDTATIKLERMAFAAGVGVDFGSAPASDGARWRLGFALDAGAIRFERVTISASNPLAPTPPDTTWSPTASGRARLARRLVGRAWLELAIGAEVLFRVPEFGVASQDSFTVHTRLRPIEPFGTLGLMIDLG